MGPTVWTDPHIFRAERFHLSIKPRSHCLGVRSAEESPPPLPTLSFGVPLGKLEDEEYHRTSHTCLGARLCQPFLKAFVKLLSDKKKFQWTLNSEATKEMRDRMLCSSQTATTETIVEE